MKECPTSCSKCNKQGTAFFPEWSLARYWLCEKCAHDKEVRADEREKAAQRVLALYGYDSDPGEDDSDNWKHNAHLAAAAARGGA